MPTPQNIVKERFETKAKLIAAVEALMTDELWVARLSADRGGNKGLKHVSNTKLLKLHDTLSTVKKEFGSRQKLIAAVLDAESRSKDADYQKRLERLGVPQLYDLLKSKK